MRRNFLSRYDDYTLIHGNLRFSANCTANRPELWFNFIPCYPTRVVKEKSRRRVLSIVTSPWTRSAVGKRELGDFRVSPFYGRYDNSASLKNTLSGNLPRFSKEDIRAEELECGTCVQHSCTLCKSESNPLIREGLRQTYGCVRYQSTKFQVYPKNFKFYSSRMLYYTFNIKNSWCSVQRLLPENISIPHCQSETLSSQENPEE